MTDRLVGRYRPSFRGALGRNRLSSSRWLLSSRISIKTGAVGDQGRRPYPGLRPPLRRRGARRRGRAQVRLQGFREYLLRSGHRFLRIRLGPVLPLCAARRAGEFRRLDRAPRTLHRPQARPGARHDGGRSRLRGGRASDRNRPLFRRPDCRRHRQCDAPRTRRETARTGRRGGFETLPYGPSARTRVRDKRPAQHSGFRSKEKFKPRRDPAPARLDIIAPGGHPDVRPLAQGNR